MTDCHIWFSLLKSQINPLHVTSRKRKGFILWFDFITWNTKNYQVLLITVVRTSLVMDSNLNSSPVESDRKKAEIDCDSEKSAAALLKMERLEKRMERRRLHGALPAKPKSENRPRALSEEEYEKWKQELSDMIAKAVAESSTLSDEAFKTKKKVLSALVATAMAHNDKLRPSDETLEKRKLELSALVAKIHSEMTRS
ncbi:uncharacterized protein LOC141654436 isoform X1 [Silene latifolia]|uniref:uncharacterized protein LOC141654436 isoform X1 n=1 Tax=Silene latifolia TaxID=37657 RepID=UPI003D78A63D